MYTCHVFFCLSRKYSEFGFRLDKFIFIVMFCLSGEKILNVVVILGFEFIDKKSMTLIYLIFSFLLRMNLFVAFLYTNKKDKSGI